MMRQLVVLAAVAGLVLARPETYREKEDFQFSRSSSDEGSKSGFYGAQRGNMGGNYERAHNMDPLAQNQMSGLVRTVEGELGDGAKQKTGSIYTAANSRGVYGSGHYDLSNLEGRNFQEGASFGAASGAASGSQSQSALTSQQSASNSAGYGSSQSHSASYGSQTHDSRYRGYNSAGNSEQAFNSNNLQQQVQHSGNLQSVNQYEDRNNAHNSGYYSQAAGYQGQGYDQGSSLSHTSNAYGSDIHSRLVSGTPVRIVIRPGTRVILPVAAQTYDASQSAGSFDQNAINSETEVLHGTEQQVALKPKTKNFESSYSYRKEWEKHDTRPLNGAAPLAIPSVTPYPANSELYEDAQALEQQQQQSSHSSHHSSHSGYNVNSASSRQAVNNAQHSSGVNTGSNAYHAYSGDSGAAYDGAYNRGASGAYNAAANGASSLNQVDDSNTKPKSYQSSYSYHKSWEHQDDPYVIKPSTNGLYDGQASGKMTAASLNQGAYDSSHQYGSQHQSHQSYSRHSNSDADCDENGHTRVVRSYNAHQNEALTRGDSIDQEELGQRTQKQRNTFSEDLGQQTQSEWDNLKELGQQTQATWEQLGQQTVNKWDNLKDEGQQTQMLWGQQETGKKWDKIEDLGQHQTIQWDPNDAGQQTQNTWDKLESGPQSQTDLGQQTQDTWTILETNPSGNDGRLTEQKLSGIDNSGPDNHGLIIGHQSDENTSEIAQSSYHQKHYTESQTWETGTNKSSTHHKNTIWDEIKKEEIGQENEDTVESDLAQATDLDQQTQVTWGNINQNQNSYNPWHQETDKVQVDLTNSEQNHPNTFQDMPNPHPWMYNQVHHSSADTNQYFAHSFSSSSSGSHSHSYNSYISNGQTNSTGSTSGSSIMSLWDKLYNIEKQTIPSHQTDDTGKQSVGQDDTANVSNTQAQHNVFDSNIAENERIEGIANAFDSHVHHNVFNSHNSNTQPLRPNTASSASTTSNPTTEAIKEDEQKRPVDLGRGDIGADDSNEQIESQPDSKPHKTPEEIETLSLTRETNKTNKHVVAPENKNEDERDLSVLPIDQQNQSEHQNTEKHSMLQADASVATTTSATQINNYNMQHHENTHHSNEEQESRDMGSQFEDQGQQSLDQQTLIHQIEDSQENQNQNTEQQLVDFGQRENLGAEQFETQNINNNEAEDGQIEQFDQVSLSEWKPVESLNQHEHKHENGGPKNMNSEQQIHSVWTGIIEDQEVQTARQPTEDAQQHSEQTNIYGKPIEDLSQKEQSVWKLTKELQQGKPTEQFDKPREDFDQQVQTDLTEGLQQESQLTDTFSQPMDQNKEHASNYHNQPGKLTEELQQSQLTEQFDRPWEDFGQQVQMDLTEGLQQESQLTATFSQPIDQNKEHASNYHKQPEVVEELIVPKKVAAVDSPPEPEVTEKPGFWKSVGNKFKDAKHTVTSWFSS